MEYHLSELLEKAALILEKESTRNEDGRVQYTPDIRMFRYYQSLGLVAKPIRYDGRVAVYAELSLQQLVLVKLLQQQGYSLQQIQHRMLGLSPVKYAELFQKVLPNGSIEQAPMLHPVKQLHSVELARGVIITVDPMIVSEPEKLIQHLFTHIQGVLL